MKHNKKIGIGIIAPSLSLSKIDSQLIEKGISKLESLGFGVKIGKNAQKSNGYISGSIEERLSDINMFLEDPSIDIIMAAFGGYNSNELVPHLNFKKIKKSNKLFMGYSDTSILLNVIYNQTNIETVIGPAFVSFCNPNIFDETLRYFLEIINDKKIIKYFPPKEYAYDNWYLKENYGPRECKAHQGWEFIKKGKCEGKLIGGNLESILALAGTKYFPKTKDKVLLVEDNANEDIGKFHREIVQLEQLGVLKDIRGLIVGKFADTLQIDQGRLLRNLLLEVTKAYNIPIVINTNFSHVDPNYAICIGSHIILESEKNEITMIRNKELND